MIKLYCDMGADIPKKYIDEYNITVFKMVISDGDNEYIIGENIDKQTIYNQMREKVVFKTSQVTYKDYFDEFEKDLKNGNEILYISLSSGITGTFNTANLVKNQLEQEYDDAKIHIIDSFGASFGYGSIVIKVARMIKDGIDIKEILDFCEFSKKHINYLFTVENLEYLYRGGRLSKTKFLLSNALNIIPIMDVSKDDGTLRLVEKARGHKALNKKILNLMNEKAENLKEQTILVAHGDCEQRALEVKKYLSEKLDNQDIKIFGIDAVIGSHTGPEVIAIIFIDKLYGKYDKFEF